MVHPTAVCHVVEGLEHEVDPAITTTHVRGRQPGLNPATRSRVQVPFFIVRNKVSNCLFNCHMPKL